MASSVALTGSTAELSLKLDRYLTDGSSYLSLATTEPTMREAEDQAAREFAFKRQASRQRVVSA